MCVYVRAGVLEVGGINEPIREHLPEELDVLIRGEAVLISVILQILPHLPQGSKFIVSIIILCNVVAACMLVLLSHFFEKFNIHLPLTTNLESRQSSKI